MSLGIYIHLPFCGKKCPYCDFYSVGYQKELVDRYVIAMCHGIERFSGDVQGRVDTIYFGGGTPSILDTEYIKRIIDTVGARFSLSSRCSITIECNPKSTTAKRIQQYAGMGINRISLGMQSAHSKELRYLGRIHSSNDVTNCITAATESGIEDISLDFMLATPHQTLERVDYTLDFIGSQPITHISAYLLKIEQNTPFYTDNIGLICPDEDRSSEIYLHAVDRLERMGLRQYEISSFAREGYESKHNLKYWNKEQYIGFGAAAHSYFNGKRYYYNPDIEGYIATDGGDIILDKQSQDSFEEHVMLQLRMTSGLNLLKAREIYGVDTKAMSKRVEALCKNGLALYSDNVVSLTPKGFLLSNSIINYILASS